jgi:hypothetical protein
LYVCKISCATWREEYKLEIRFEALMGVTSVLRVVQRDP